MDNETAATLGAEEAQHESPVPKVSIGMPVYNGEPFIREALDSLLAQTFTDFELIISDNASTDGTEVICQEYAAKDSRIRYVRQKENRGSAANFQFVLDEAVGEYFMWAAADDLWLPEFVEACVGLLVEDNAAQMAMTGYKCVSRFSFIFNRTFPPILSCIEMSEAEHRVLAYAAQPFSTHKDNLVYSLWRKGFIQQILTEISSILNGRSLIGAAMNEYVLIKACGRYSGKTLFLKCYRYLPPGHWAQSLINFLVPLWRRVRGKPRRGDAPGYGGNQFLVDLGYVLDASGVSRELALRVIGKNKQHVRVSA